MGSGPHIQTLSVACRNQCWNISGDFVKKRSFTKHSDVIIDPNTPWTMKPNNPTLELDDSPTSDASVLPAFHPSVHALKGVLAAMPTMPPSSNFTQFHGQPAPRVSMLAPTWLMANINSLLQSLDQKSLSKTATALEIFFGGLVFPTPPSQKNKGKLKISKWHAKIKRYNSKHYQFLGLDGLSNFFKCLSVWTHNFPFPSWLFVWLMVSPCVSGNRFRHSSVPLRRRLVHDTKLHASYSSLKW